jgi:hypothetical protein
MYLLVILLIMKIVVSIDNIPQLSGTYLSIYRTIFRGLRGSHMIRFSTVPKPVLKPRPVLKPGPVLNLEAGSKVT